MEISKREGYIGRLESTYIYMWQWWGLGSGAGGAGWGRELLPCIVHANQEKRSLMEEARIILNC